MTIIRGGGGALFIAIIAKTDSAATVNLMINFMQKTAGWFLHL